jgi:hypothetical protein
MSRNKDLRDLAIQIAISGDESPGNSHIQIESDYLKREREENRREQGLFVRMDLLERTDLEKSIWNCDRLSQEVNNERWLKGQVEKDSHLENDYDEDRLPIVVSKRIIKV